MIFALLRSLLQASVKGSVAIVLIAIVDRLIGRRVRASWRYALWLAVLVRLFVPIAPQTAWSIFNLVPAHPGIESMLRGRAGAIVLQSGSIVVPWWIETWRWIAAIWFLGALVVASRAVIATARMHAIVRRGGRRPDAARRIIEELRIGRRVDVIESPRVAVPALHGVLRPTLLLPAGMCESFRDEELRHVIAHELAHLRRHDVAINWILTAVRAIHWFNPLVWAAAAHVEEERELACDELALSSLAAEERLRYGRTLLKLIERLRAARPAPALVGIVDGKERMKRRLVMIAAPRTSSRSALLVAALLAIALFATLTDARGSAGAALDPAGIATLDAFDRPVTVDLTNVSFAELVDTIAAKSGVAIRVTMSPAREARFTLHAHNVPARRLLTRALLPFGLFAAPSGDAMRITAAPPCFARGAPR